MKGLCGEVEEDLGEERLGGRLTSAEGTVTPLDAEAFFAHRSATPSSLQTA